MTDKVKAVLAEGLSKVKAELAELSTREKYLKELKGQFEEKLLDTLTDEIPSYRTEHGTVADYEKEFFTMDQPKLCHRHAEESGDFGIFAKSVNNEYCKAYREEHGELPPGIISRTKRYLSFTAPRNQLPER